jgi:hypothetical protein
VFNNIIIVYLEFKIFANFITCELYADFVNDYFSAFATCVLYIDCTLITCILYIDCTLITCILYIDCTLISCILYIDCTLITCILYIDCTLHIIHRLYFAYLCIILDERWDCQPQLLNEPNMNIPSMIGLSWTTDVNDNVILHWFYLSSQTALTGYFFVIYDHWPKYSFSGTWIM